MRIRRIPGKGILWEHGFVGYLFTPGIKARTVLFDQDRKVAVVSKGLFRKTVREIPFRGIRRILHRIYAPIYFSSEVPGVRLESDWSEISLLLSDASREILYQEYYMIDNKGRPGRGAIRRILGMAGEIAEITDKPILIDWEEAEISLDLGSAKIFLAGDLIPPAMRGREIPFREVEAVQAVRADRGYYAVCIASRDGESFLTTQGYDTYTCLHDTTELVARTADLPFQKVESISGTIPIVGKRYAPITPTMRGTVPGRPLRGIFSQSDSRFGISS